MTSRSAMRRGFFIAVAGHILLLLFFLIRFSLQDKRQSQPVDTIEVTFAHGVGIHSSSPEASSEAARATTAPKIGEEKEAAPAPKKETPKEADNQPKAQTQTPAKAEAKVENKPVAKPEPQPRAKPIETPKPAPVAKPEPQPRAKPIETPKPAPVAKPEPQPREAAVAPAQKAKVTAAEKTQPKAESKTPSKPHNDVKNLMESFSKSQVNVSDHKAGSNTESNKGKEKSNASDSGKSKSDNSRNSGSRLGSDFLKGILGGTGTSSKPQGSSISGPALNGLGAAIKRQVQPCYDLGALGGTDAMRIITVLRLRFNPDGSVNGVPEMIEQTGLTSDNRSYARQMAEISRRAVLRCAPLHLPAELYKGGWDEIDIGFIPAQMH
ncbi:TolA protein [Zymomonas mobilis]|uniref:hypothetical protein n=1 Tax=Zymomonas mobilis TaxID=542 RepID=UPI00026D8034|nr:hypothetical protein [Zymomonas mobilis]AFN56932.1 hypothetical protein ZZ6_1044 [Zymomonas mobilis subsp. mobilis ATCC 29191]TQK77630.1 TolA protein [Zymomonas mobilis]TQL15720.1 TolA protein [Zymomonas mobilis]